MDQPPPGLEKLKMTAMQALAFRNAFVRAQMPEAFAHLGNGLAVALSVNK